MWRVATAVGADAEVARFDRVLDDLPLLLSVCAMAAAKAASPPSAARSRLRLANRNSMQTTKVTAAASTTDRITPRWLPGAVWNSTAKIEPGAAGATRPDWKMTLVSTPVAPPAMSPTIRMGLART